ncbi:Uncharacterised protein [Mycobacteroides abscessus]|nr:Uncharacterised protein [Mycobacteroides abscessus]
MRGSFANCRRVSSSQARAPLRHASSSGTTWSIWTAALVALPRRKSIVSPVYGSSKVPVRTSQTSPRVEKVRSVRSRARMSLRVSHPLPSTSAHAGPNSARS